MNHFFLHGVEMFLNRNFRKKETQWGRSCDAAIEWSQNEKIEKENIKMERIWQTLNHELTLSNLFIDFQHG